MLKSYKNVKALLDQSQHIVVTTHLEPDPDGIASQIALGLILQKMGKNAIYCVNEESLPQRYNHLKSKETIIPFEKYQSNKTIDLFIIIDANNSSRIGPQMEKLLQKSKRVLFIDHHPCSASLAALHCIDSDAAASGQIVGELAEFLGIEINSEIALLLYMAILTDTSSFRYPSVSEKTHLLLAKLLKSGVTPSSAYNMIYGAKKINHLQLLGEVLSKAQTNTTGELAWILLTEEAIAKHNVNIEDTRSFINHLLILDKVKIACMFLKYGHKVKIGLRSCGEVNVGLIAQALGGGGHYHSAATIIEGDAKKIIKDTITRITHCL